MKIKNTMSKVVGIGTAILRPDAVVEINDNLAEAPAVKAMIEKGLLEVIEEAKKLEEHVPEEAVKEAAEETAEEVKIPKTKAKSKNA